MANVPVTQTDVQTLYSKIKADSTLTDAQKAQAQTSLYALCRSLALPLVADGYPSTF